MANTIFQKATHWLVCKENFEFKWVNTPFLEKKHPTDGKRPKMSSFLNPLTMSSLCKSNHCLPFEHF